MSKILNWFLQILSNEVGEAKDVASDISDNMGYLGTLLDKVGDTMTEAQLNDAKLYYNRINILKGSGMIWILIDSLPWVSNQCIIRRCELEKCFLLADNYQENLPQR